MYFISVLFKVPAHYANITTCEVNAHSLVLPLLQ